MASPILLVNNHGQSGFSGYSGGGGGGGGQSGFSGYSGASGKSGYSGTSGFSGTSGYSGASGYSGTSGQNGSNGISGFSGYSGKSGYSGTSGQNGSTGTSGFSGYSGKSGYSGTSGTSGTSGFSGTSGYSGAQVGTPISPSNGGTGLTTLTAHGVLLGEGTSNVGFATIGDAGKVLTDNGSGVDPSFKTPLQKLSFTFDGGGSAITGTPFSWAIAQRAGTIVGYYLVADQSASVVMTVKKVAFGSYTGSSSFSSIVGAGTAPSLSSAVSSSDTTLTSWTTSVAANDIIQVAISSVSTATHIQIFFMINGS